MADEYIKREKLLTDMHNSHSVPLFIGHKTDEDVMFETMLDIVKEQPAADVVEVVHGHWILSNTNPYGDPNIKNRTQKICSCCGWTNACRYAYCPNCGAKMDGKGD